jgi:diaminopimelate decarboxylase
VIIVSPNVNVRPLTASVNQLNHLTVGGCDLVDLASRFGTPLWIMDEQTIRASAEAIQAGLANYPGSRVLYAGKAFLCQAMCHLVRRLGLGLDVVSAGELHTAKCADFPAELIFMHGNNKTESEIRDGLTYGPVKIVIDSQSELAMVAGVASQLAVTADILLRVTPGVVPDTHHYIKTGHNDSKFGFPMTDVPSACKFALEHKELNLLGLHAHIGSQSHELEPYLQIVDILADCYADLRQSLGLTLSHLDVGGGLGIAYIETDRPVAAYDWSASTSKAVEIAWAKRDLTLPELYLEPGRAIAGTAGVTLYRAGHAKELPGGLRYLAVDGGMADNPRPVTYQAQYTACVANRVNQDKPTEPITIAGKYCESGDIIIKDAYLTAQTGDLVAIFATGAYNYSMSSNYNRTGRPACVLVYEGQADIIIERESYDDLMRQDRVPAKFHSAEELIS